MMKKISIVIFYCIFITLLVFPQHNRNAYRVSKEDNWRENRPNVESKCSIEKLLSGDFNAPVEFFYLPAEESRGDSPLSFRIVRDSSDSLYVAEIKHIIHFDWSRWLHSGTLLSPSRIEGISFSVSQLFAEKLQEKTQVFISTFEEENPFSPVLYFCDTTNEWIELITEILGGYSVTFRTVVDDEVWSLWIHMPQNKALGFSTLFRQMIEDAKAGEFDEERYMVILGTLE
jgi:hypothetical protein